MTTVRHPRQLLRRPETGQSASTPALLQSLGSTAAFGAGSFKTFLLKEGTTIICAGTVRIFGTMMAEVPFVGTKEGYRFVTIHKLLCRPCLHVGNHSTLVTLQPAACLALPRSLRTWVVCRKQGALRAFMAGLEAILAELGVKQMLVASIMPLKHMWRDRFGFEPLTVEEATLAEEYLVSPDPETCVMMRKPLGAQAKYEDTLTGTLNKTRQALNSSLAQHDKRRREREAAVGPSSASVVYDSQLGVCMETSPLWAAIPIYVAWSTG